MCVTIGVLVVVLLAFTRFLEWVEDRQGITFVDPLLRLYAPTDVTWITFTLIYAGVILGVFLLARRPDRLLLALQAYTIMVLIRFAAMYVLPFDPPPAIIVLKDPFVQMFGTGRAPTRDLFFSGHTATMFLLYLTVRERYARIVFLVCTVGVGIAVLIQHVHYTVDVFAAPFFAYCAYRAAVVLEQLRVVRDGKAIVNREK
jgi:membrane-associated phospholipid phosphatase